MSTRSVAVQPAVKPEARPVAGLSRRTDLDTRHHANVIELRGSEPDGAGGMPGQGIQSLFQPPPETGNGDGGGRNFARTSLHASSAATVLDEDAGRALITHLLVHELAPMLGLDPSKIRIRANAESEARTNARGAGGVMEGGTVFLHPQRYRPLTREGRHLLAHELAHVAQRLLPGRGPLADALAKKAAETEADLIGDAFAKDRAVERPLYPLPMLAVAADKDAPPPDLQSSVSDSRSREIAQITNLVSGLWVSDGDVFNVLEILESVAFPVAKAIVKALGKKQRYWLADNINPPHIYKHRKMVLACYAALDDDQYGAVDLKVFRALPVTGMSTEETEAAYTTLQKLGDERRLKLVESDNGDAIARIISAPRPSKDELERLRKDEEDVARDEAALADKRKAILATQKDDSAKDVIDQVKERLSARREDDTDHLPNGYDAVMALELLGQADDGSPRFLYIAEQLEQAGYIDTLLQMLPSDSYVDNEKHSKTLFDLVQSRLPWKNAKLIESLLSYGLFDWAIRDYEALFAYRMIKLLPLTEQYRFRQRDAGKWYMRLMENLPDYKDDKGKSHHQEGLEIRKADSAEDLKKLKDQGFSVDEKEMLYNASQVYEKKLQDKGATQTLNDLIAAFKEAKKGIYRDEEAKGLYRKLVVLGGSSLEKGKEHPADLVLREAIIHELDTLGYIDELFGELPDSFLFDEENRISTVKIMLARDPSRVQAHARNLVSRGFTDWMVNDGEAYLAYMCVKSLPQDERDAFIQHNAEEWKRINGEMSEAQRQSRDLNLYIGDKAGTDRASVLGQLAMAETWTEENASLLDGLLLMAMAMTEHRYAFERSKEFKVNNKNSVTLKDLVAKYRLWDPDKRPDYKPDALKGTKWYEEGIFADLKTLWSGLVTLWNLDVLFIDHKVGLKADLNDVQDFMGGDLGGAKLGNPKKRSSGPDTNKVILLMGTDGKSAEVILPELIIDSANIQMAGSTLQSGPITLKSLHIHAAYDSDSLGQPTQAHVQLASVEAHDLLLAKSNSMIAVTRLVVQALRLAAGTIDTVTGGDKGERKGRSVPFPLLVVPLLALFLLLALPVYLYKKIAAMFDQGLESNTGEHFAADVAERTKSVEFSFGSLDVEGLTTSGGQHIGHVGVQDFALRLGLNKPTRLRAEKASIEQRLTALQSKPEAAEAVAKLAERKAAIDTELAGLDKQEKEYLQIKKRILKGGLKASEQAQLQMQLNKLNFEDKGAAYIDIGSVEASGISGTLTSKQPIRLSNIHGEGGGAALTELVGMPTVTPMELNRRSRNDERPDALLANGKEGALSLELGDVSTGEIALGGGIRSVADIDTKLKELEPLKKVPEMVALYESLQLLRPKAERYELMVQHGVSALTPEQLDEFRELRRVLTAEADLVIKSIDITKLTIDINLANGRVDIGAESADIKGIKLAGKGIEIDEVIARGLGVGAMPAGGLLNWQDWKKNLKDADGKIDFLQASGVRSKYHGLLFQKATLTGPYAKMKDRGNLLEVGLKNFTVEGVGVAPRIGLLNQRLAGLEEKAKALDDKDEKSKAEKAKLNTEITKLRSNISELQALADARVAAYLKLEAAKTPEEIEAAKDAVAESDNAIIIGLAQYGASRIELDDFGIRATGAGDVMSDVLGSGLDVDRIVKRGARIQGTGPGNRVLRRFALTGANAKDTQKDSAMEASGNFELGETKLDVNIKREGDSVNINLDQFSIASVAVSNLLYTADQDGVGAQIESTGSSGLEGIRLSGKLRMDKRKGVKGEGKFPSDFRFAHIDVTDFRIDAIRANGLAYRSLSEKLEATIKSGSINGIWAKGMSIDLPENGKMAVTGSAGIESITDVEIAGALNSGLRLEQGKINASALQVDFLKEGEIEATLGDLSMTAMSVRGPDGWARFSLNHLSGAVNYKDGVFTVRKVKLGSFEVPGIDWRAGKKHIKADKMAKVVDLSVSGKVTTRKEPPTDDKAKAKDAKEQKTIVSKVSISEFHIGSVIADHLIYEDGDNRIEVGVADKDLPAEMKGFKPLFISDVSVKDLEWDEKKGLVGENMNVDVKKFEASAVYKNLKDGMTAGFALKGVDMGATFVGSKFMVASTGIIEKTGGFYKGNGIDTTFKTGQIFGSFTFGDDYIALNNLEVDKVAFGHTTYTGEDGKKVELQSAGIGHITIGKVQADMETVKDDQGKDTKKVKQITVDEIVLTDIHADMFTYTGTTVTVDEKKQTVTKDMTVSGNKAWIDRFTISDVKHDMAKKLTTLNTTIDNREAGKPAFGIDKLHANIIKTIGTKRSVTELAADVEGSELTGKNISFQTIPLGKTLGKDGKTWEPVTRTAIGGQFSIDRIGLLNPEARLTDESGKVTTIKTYGQGKNKGQITISGVTPRLYPNGTMVVPIDSIKGEKFVIEKHGMKAFVPLLELKKFAIALKGMGSAEGMQVLAAKLKEVSVKNVSMTMTINRGEADTDTGEPGPPGPTFFAEPVGEMTGELEVEPQLHHWYLPDPNVVMPIRNGQINFEDVHPYAVNLRKGEITIGNYKKIEISAKKIPEMPGMHPEQGKYGVLNFRELIEGIMNKPKPPKDPNAKAEDPADLSGLNDLFLGGHIKLGKGKIGVDTNKSGKPDDGDFFAEIESENAEDNEAKIPWNAVGKDVEVNIKRLRAARMAIPGSKDFPAGKTGEATVSNIKVNVTGLANMEFRIHVFIKEGKIVNIEFGDVSVLDDNGKGDFPGVQAKDAPGLTDVNPKGVEGTP